MNHIIAMVVSSSIAGCQGANIQNSHCALPIQILPCRLSFPGSGGVSLPSSPCRPRLSGGVSGPSGIGDSHPLVCAYCHVAGGDINVPDGPKYVLRAVFLRELTVSPSHAPSNTLVVGRPAPAENVSISTPSSPRRYIVVPPAPFGSGVPRETLPFSLAMLHSPDSSGVVCPVFPVVVISSTNRLNVCPRWPGGIGHSCELCVRRLAPAAGGGLMTMRTSFSPWRALLPAAEAALDISEPLVPRTVLGLVAALDLGGLPRGRMAAMARVRGGRGGPGEVSFCRILAWARRRRWVARRRKKAMIIRRARPASEPRAMPMMSTVERLLLDALASEPVVGSGGADVEVVRVVEGIGEILVDDLEGIGVSIVVDFVVGATVCCVEEGSPDCRSVGDVGTSGTTLIDVDAVLRLVVTEGTGTGSTPGGRTPEGLLRVVVTVTKFVVRALGAMVTVVKVMMVRLPTAGAATKTVVVTWTVVNSVLVSPFPGVSCRFIFRLKAVTVTVAVAVSRITSTTVIVMVALTVAILVGTPVREVTTLVDVIVDVVVARLVELASARLQRD